MKQLLFCLFFPALLHAQQKPNVLFIFVDDLRPDLGCYGNPEVRSPHLDSLAGHATVFRRQYVTVPTCGASRVSLLTGRYPRTKSDLSNDAAKTRMHGGPAGALPETFIEQLKWNGYYTVGIGKVSHSADGYVYPYTSPKSDRLELPHSWNEMLFDPGKWKTGWNAFFAYANGDSRISRKGEAPPYESAPVDDEGYPDGLTAKLAIKKIEELAGKDQPFFLGVGFFKPHLPFNAPQKYWDLYQEEDISLTHSPGIPQNVHPASLHESGEFNQYRLGDEKASLERPVTDTYARKLRHGYYAGISYVDAQIGKVLAALKRSGLDRNTVIVVWGDHGYHLGDDRVWGKHTVFEYALRSVLILKTPQQQKGAACGQVVSSADIYPTLMELCGVKMPYRADGESIASLTRKTSDPSLRNAAYSYFRQGVTLRTSRYRLTKYYRKAQPQIELYDHENDPYENRNIAAEEPATVQRLMKLLDEGDTGVFREGAK
jgi:arylsulfatase A-like enzyme